MAVAPQQEAIGTFCHYNNVDIQHINGRNFYF